MFARRSHARAVRDSNDARVVGGRRDARERELAALEWSDALTANHPRMDPEAELIDEAELAELVRQLAAAIGDDHAVGGLLDLRDGLGELALEQRGVPSERFSQRARR